MKVGRRGAGVGSEGAGGLTAAEASPKTLAELVFGHGTILCLVRTADRVWRFLA